MRYVHSESTSEAGGGLYKIIQPSSRNFYVVFRHMPGKRISTGTRDMSVAIRFAEKYLERDGLKGIGSQDMTLRQCATDFFLRTDSLSLRYRYSRLHINREKEYWAINQGYLDNYILPGLGSKRLDSLTPAGIENWLLDVQGVSVKELSGGTKGKILQCLKTILDEAVRQELIPDNPADKAKAPRSIGGVRSSRIFSLYEQKLLMPDDLTDRINLWGSLMWASYFSVLADTGMRPGEVMGLRVKDVYRTPQGYGVVAVQEVSSDGKRIKARVKTSGKGMEKRVALLSDSTGLLIEELVKVYQITDEEECLFLKYRDIKDSYIGIDTANKHLKGVLKKLDLEEASQYSFRHTFATFRRGNADERALALAMGHSGGSVRDDYDHRSASILIGQLEKHRSQLMASEEDGMEVDSIKPAKKA